MLSQLTPTISISASIADCRWARGSLFRKRGDELDSRAAAMADGASGGTASICNRKMPDGKFDLTVGKLSPFLNDSHEAATGRLSDNLAGFASSGVNGQGK
jgi:hypothetical protein